MHTPSRANPNKGIHESVSAGRCQAHGIDIETSPASLTRQHETHCTSNNSARKHTPSRGVPNGGAGVANYAATHAPTMGSMRA